MPDTYETGVVYSSGLPDWQRVYYDGVLMQTLRTKSILVPYSPKKTEFGAINSKQITMTEVLDLEPNWNPTSETTIWKKGMALDSRSLTLDLAYYHDIIKYSDHLDTWNYLNSMDAKGIIREKLGQSMVDFLDILCRNAYLTHPDKTFAGTATTRAGITASDLLDPDIAETIRIHLQEKEVPGIATNNPDSVATLVCLTTPRAIYDIRMQAGSQWVDVHNYIGDTVKLNGEIGSWAGVRFVTTQRLKLWNAGLAVNQTRLNGATVEGQGAAATVDGVYHPGQTGSTRTIPVDEESGFSVGDYVTFHDNTLGVTVLETDGTQETRRIVSLGTNTISLDRPLLKAHANDDYVTKAVNIHASIFLGGPSVIWGIAEAPTVIVPPKYDDAMLINRIGWRMLGKFQYFRPEWFEVHESAGSLS